MPAGSNHQPPSVLSRQAIVCGVVAALMGLVVAMLYVQDRRREWMLRQEQANRGLEVAAELIRGEFGRVQADVLFLADGWLAKSFVSDRLDTGRVAREYASFMRRKGVYDQIRLLDLNGHEILRLNYQNGEVEIVADSDLQDKSDRYYFQEGLELATGQVLASDFDLNLEHGEIERPLKPVVRFVTPVGDEQDRTAGFLILNYLGSALLNAIDESAVPGEMMVLRADGQYIHGLQKADAWGWLLSHQRTFPEHYPTEWKMLVEQNVSRLTNHGAFAVRRVEFPSLPESEADIVGRNSVVLMWHLPRTQVFAESRKLLTQSLLLATLGLLPIALVARRWAQATSARQAQTQKIADSEERLRKLSARLLRIQEDERRAISREIHDELGQQVTAINLDLKLAEKQSDLAAVGPHLTRAIRENATLLASLHDFASRVRPAVLDDLGLQDAIESQIWDFQSRTNIQVEASLRLNTDDIPNVVADNAYRLVQESLNNVAKHSRAKHVWIDLDAEPGSNGHPRQLRLSVRDDGCGYQEDDSSSDRLGLVGMRERVDLLGGNLHMESVVGRGTKVEIQLPFATQEERRNQKP